MTWPQPTRQSHEKFCQTEGWDRVRDARGRTGTHHITYELRLRDARILRTRISHPADRSTYGLRIWAHILRDQLEVDADDFWNCVQDGVKPRRGAPETPVESLPLELVHLLIHRVGLAEAEVAAMTKDEAGSRLSRFWAKGS